MSEYSDMCESEYDKQERLKREMDEKLVKDNPLIYVEPGKMIPTTKSSVQHDGECFLVPTMGRLIIKEDTFKYSGVLEIPEQAKRRPTVGEIVAIGEGVSEELKLGNRVVYGQFSGTLLTFKQRPSYRVLGQDEIIAVVIKEDEELWETEV